tara:strand:+ start:374 stop:2152 length:1779 start_codon:yes stop_codon:yes gene_type:complete
MKKIIFISLIFLLTKINAQQDFILYHMPSIPQITQVDPASFPDSKLDIGLPIISSVYGSIFNTGFSIGDIFYQNADGTMMPDVDNAISKMSSENFFILNGSTDLIFVGFKKGNNFFSFNVTEKLDFTFNYPKDLIVLAMEGNGNNLLGKRASLDGLGFDFTHWREYAIHWVHDVHHKFSYGARLKYLYGMENFTTDVSYMGIETDQNTHALKFDMAFDFRTSGLPQIMVDGDIPVIGGLNTNDSIAMQQSGFSPGYINNYLFNRNNRGLGVDFGFNYHISDKLLLEASVLDLGFINWNSYTANSKLEAWDYEYDGISNPISIFGDGSSVDFLKDVLEDSIEEDLKNNYSYSNESYSTALRTKIYASMEYTVDHNNFVSLSLYSSFVRGIWRRGLGLAYNYHLGNFLSATASYSIYNRSYSNLGFGVSVNLGPVEIYCLTDNVLAFGTLNPRDNFLSSTASSINIDTKKVRNGQIHFGLNLTFGRDKKEKPVDEADQGRAKAVNSGSDDQNKESSAKDKKSSNSGSSSETNTPKRTNYDSKGNSDKKQKTKKAKTSYNKKTEKKKNTRKGELKTKVEQSAPKSSTARKVSRKL